MSKIIDALNWRYATKEFDSGKVVSEDDINELVEAFRLTASSYGLQMWHLVNVKDAQLRKELLPFSWHQRQVVDASHLFVLCRTAEAYHSHIEKHIQKTADIRDQKYSDLIKLEEMIKKTIDTFTDEQSAVWLKDQCYIALGTLMTVCALKGIDSCPMEGFQADKYDEILDLKSKGLKSVVVLPIGYRDKNDVYAPLAKVRFDTEDIYSEL